MLSETERARRRPVWIALSELWLDTELDENDLNRIADVLRNSGYNLVELRQIYLKEVAPVVYLNTLSVAGEWAGFDPDWLSEEAAKRAEKGGPVRDRRWNVKQAIQTAATEDLWRRLEELLS